MRMQHFLFTCAQLVRIAWGWSLGARGARTRGYGTVTVERNQNQRVVYCPG